MASSIFGAEQRVSEPLSALAVLTGRHREKNTRDPVLGNSQRVNEINESTIWKLEWNWSITFVSFGSLRLLSNFVISKRTSHPVATFLHLWIYSKVYLFVFMPATVPRRTASRILEGDIQKRCARHFTLLLPRYSGFQAAVDTPEIIIIYSPK